MAKYGTAPRKVNGVWVTAKGRRLKPEGQKYWSDLHAQGRTDSFGHITKHATATAASGPVKKPGFDTYVRIKHGEASPKEIRQAKLYQASQKAKKEAPQIREQVEAAKGYDQPVFKKAAKAAPVIHPAARKVIESLSPGPGIIKGAGQIRHGKVLPGIVSAGVAASTIMPGGGFGEGGRAIIKAAEAAKAAKAAKAARTGKVALAGFDKAGKVIVPGRAAAKAKAAEAAAAKASLVPSVPKVPATRTEKVAQAGLTKHRALVSGEKVQQITKARSRVTQNVIEKPVDIISRRYPNAPVIGERTRVAKAAGREKRFAQETEQTIIANRARVFPKSGSDESAAHFHWAQLPDHLHNEKGLQTVKAGLQTELDRTLRGHPLAVQKKASKSLIAKQARVARLQTAADRAAARVAKQQYTRHQLKQIGGVLVDPDTEVKLQTRLDSVNAQINNLRGKPQFSDEIKALREQRRQLNVHLRFAGGLGKLQSEFVKEAENLGVAASAGVKGADELLARSEALTAQLKELGGIEKRANVPKELEDEARDLRKALKTFRENRPSIQQGSRIITGKGGVMEPIGTQRMRTLHSALSVAKDELATAEKRFARPGKPSRLARAKLPADARNLAAHIAQLDRTIAKGVTAKPEVIAEVRRMDDELTKTLEQVGYLEGVDKKARRSIVANWLGVTPSGKEAYIGHRVGKVRGSGGIRSMGFGKPAAPQSTRGRNRLRLLKTGTVRADVHVAAEDLQAAQTYRNQLAARQDLWEMAPEPFTGHVPDGWLLVNPEGQVVPASMKADVLAGITDNPEEIAAAIPSAGEMQGRIPKEITGFLSDPKVANDWKRIVREAKATGTFDKLRIIPERDAQKYFAQFLPAGFRNPGGRAYDKLVDMTALSLIFGRLGYIPKNIAQNLVTAIPHQGAYWLFNQPRAAQLIPHPGQSEADRRLWDLLASHMGGGQTGAVAQETTTKAISKPAQWVTGVADNPFRVSAFIHEAAAKGYISKVSTHLGDEDKKALLALAEGKTPKTRADLHDVRQISKDAMGDFNRLNPQQRRWARRFLIVPGWLVAGTRYPVHFAATHPGRAAALAYAAAGEPGADRLGLPQNKPIDEYLQKGLPSYIQGIKIPEGVPLVGGKTERIQSMLPGSIPADIGLAALQGAPLPTLGSYINPLPETAYNVSKGVYETPSGETRKTSRLDALRGGVERLAPNIAFGEALAGTRKSKTYPDTSLGGTLAREAGVVPVKIDPDAALKQRYGERGMTKSIQALSDQQDFYKALDDAGYQPDPPLKQAFKIRLERSNRLDKIHAHGLTYQKRAYKADLAYAVELGKIDKKTAAAYLADLKDSDDEGHIDKIRRQMADDLFGGKVIRDAREHLRNEQEG